MIITKGAEKALDKIQQSLMINILISGYRGIISQHNKGDM